MHILWCGPYFSDKALREKKSPNQAAAKWSRGLLSALRSQGISITALSHCPEQLWPRGRVFWQNDLCEWFLADDECARIGYPNLPFLRETYLDFVYSQRVRKILARQEIDAVVCYNSLHSFHVAAMKMAHRMDVPSIPIILDGDDPRRDHWQKITRDTRYASGIAFLSWWAFQNFPNEGRLPLLHLDGGTDAWNGGAEPHVHSKNEPFRLVYTGALDRWRGLDFVRHVVRACPRADVRFILCGKYDKVRMWTEFDRDSRVDVHGFVAEEELRRICQAADLFLNVRDPNIGDNILNYPSKIPQYLSWGKPVISTWIDSFSPEYRNLLQIPKDESVKAYVDVLNDVLSWSDEIRMRNFLKIRSWFLANKLWEVQTARFVDFIRSVCDDRRCGG